MWVSESVGSSILLEQLHIMLSCGVICNIETYIVSIVLY